MHRFLKITLILFVFLTIAGVGLIRFVLLAHADLKPYEHLFVDQADQAVPGEVRVTYAGVSTMLISDGTTNLMVDGFFTRPDILHVMFDKVSPNDRVIDRGLERLGVAELDAIFPVHAHYDHAMDTPIVAAKTGAKMLGGKSAAMIARGAGLPEEQIVVVAQGEVLRFGAFDIRFIESVHAPVATQNAMQPDIHEPLTPPAKAFAYPTGQAWAIVIGHTDQDGMRHQMLVQGSAGFVEGALDDENVDAVFLGIGGLGSQPPLYQMNYWNETVSATDPQKVYPIHWDDFFIRLSEPLKASGGPLNKFSDGMDFLLAEAEAEGRTVHMMKAFATVLPFRQ